MSMVTAARGFDAFDEKTKLVDKFLMPYISRTRRNQVRNAA